MKPEDKGGLRSASLGNTVKPSGEPVELPGIPEPTEVEIELTNFCNARCLACPRHALSAPKGFMSENVFRSIVDSYAAVRETLTINRFLGKLNYPMLTLAGVGEPTLHSDLSKFARLAVQSGFEIILFSNGSRLDERLGEKIVSAGVQRIYISFWGIEEKEYTSSMGLDYRRSLANVDALARLCRGTLTRLVVCWVRTPVTHSTPEEVAAFWRDRGIEVDMSEFDPWNRGGLVTDPRFKPLFESYKPVDLEKPIWCSQLYFTDTITWEGDIVLCSQDYFKRHNVLGNVLDATPAEIGLNKKNILNARPVPEICNLCRKPDRNYRFGSEPWDRILKDEQQRAYVYD